MVSVAEPSKSIGLPKVGPVPTAIQQPVRLQARADVAYSIDWTPEEQVALDATLDKYPAARHSALERYVRAAAAIHKKTVRDVALRVRWLATGAHATKRRLTDDGLGKKRPRVQSIFAVQPKGAPPLGIPAPGVPAALPPSAQPSILVPGDDHGNSHSTGMVSGLMAQLLEQNYLILNQYKQNMQQYKVHENTELLVRFRDNILTILGQMNSMSGLMQHMPPLPVRLNVELASNFLPKAGSGGNEAAGQPILQASGALQESGNYTMPAVPFQLSMNVAPIVPVSSAQQPKSSPRSQDTKTSSGRSKSKSGSKRRTSQKSEDKPAKSKQEVRTSARRAAQKTTPKPVEVRSSARLAAASDSAQS